MKKSLNALTYGMSMVLAAGMVFMSSCSKDGDKDPEPETVTLSFEDTEMTVNEADGVVEIKLVLSAPAPEDFTVEYELDGTARDADNADTNGFFDYGIDAEDVGEVDFEQGDESAIIKIVLIQDPYLEGYDDETNSCAPELINISIEDVDSDLVEISNDDEIDISVDQEDGMIAVLDWGPSDPEADPYTDVDMDLILWWEEGGQLVPTGFTLPGGSFASPEARFIPLLPDGPYGFSYNYYEGSVEPMEWVVGFIDVVDGAIEEEDGVVVFEDNSYNLANRNKWDIQGEKTPLILAQTFDIENRHFKNFSTIHKEETGSRVSAKLLEGVKRAALSSSLESVPASKLRRE